MMERIMDPAIQTIEEIIHMLTIAFRGHSPGVQVGYVDGNLVQTGLYNDTDPARVIVPLLMGTMIAGGYTFLLEHLGYAVAKTTGVGQKLLEKIALAKAKGSDTWLLEKKYKARHETFAAAFTEMMFYSIDIFIAYRLFWGSSWSHPSQWFSGPDGCVSDGRQAVIPNIPAHHSPREMRAFYIIEFGFYASNLFSVLTKKRKKDFWQMVTHHVLTSFLIGFSYNSGYLRIGIIIMLCHSAFDPFLNAAKCFHYIFNKNSTMHILADISFALCAIIFFVFRFCLYPYAIACSEFSQPGMRWHTSDTTEKVLKIMLLGLLPIHVFWFYLIMRVLTKALGGGTVQGDVREDDDDTSDSDDEPNDKKQK